MVVKKEKMKNIFDNLSSIFNTEKIPFKNVEELIIENNNLQMYGESNPFYGKKHTDATKKLIGEKTKLLRIQQPHLFVNSACPGEKNGMYNVHRFGKENPMFGKKQTAATREKMSNKAKGRPSPRKGFNLTLETKKLISEKNSKEYEFLKNGELIKIKNLTEFCKINNLNVGCMSHVAAGRNKTHKGYSINV